MRQVQENQEKLKLNVTHQFVVYADDERDIKQNTEAVLVATKVTDLEENAEKIES
jgi:hypothetical protein